MAGNLKDRVGDYYRKGKETVGDVGKKVGDAIDEVKDGYVQTKMLQTMKSSALALADVTAEIDAQLRERSSPYEVGYYRVSGSLTVVGGVTFDIFFTKSTVGKEESEYVVIINPKTDSQLRVPRKALIGRETAQIRDPETGDILTIDVKTRQVLP